jgi:hypothetical protein
MICRGSNKIGPAINCRGGAAGIDFNAKSQCGELKPNLTLFRHVYGQAGAKAAVAPQASREDAKKMGISRERLPVRR